ncbi:MAG: hypothetical protein JWQ66_2950 [Mucilaginibacter sp.]|nr:hypothetical protein [Mucilaginibacter sp.]
MEGSLFYQAQENVRETYVKGSLVNGLLPDNKGIPEFLAKLSLYCSTTDQAIALGTKALQEFCHRSNSTRDLEVYLKVFGDYFGQIF